MKKPSHPKSAAQAGPPPRSWSQRRSDVQKGLALATGIWVAAKTGHKLLTLKARPARRQALHGQVAVITGASSGIGKALAVELAAAGCKLVLAARRVDLLKALAAELESRYSIETLVVRCDISDQAQAEAMIAQAQAHFGQIDILVNNAGIADYSYFHKDAPAAMRKVMDVNYWGTVYCSHAALPAMIARRSGMIVNVSSVAGKLAQAGIGNYSATKHAVNGLSDALRVELANKGIHVLLVCPTSTKTDIVSVSSNHSGARFNPENYIGMSAERVARDTLTAILDRRRELVFGAAEHAGVGLRYFAPRLLESLLRIGTRFVFKE